MAWIEYSLEQGFLVVAVTPELSNPSVSGEEPAASAAQPCWWIWFEEVVPCLDVVELVAGWAFALQVSARWLPLLPGDHRPLRIRLPFSTASGCLGAGADVSWTSER